MKKGIYEHYKGNRYELVGIANHSETLEKMVVYKALYGEGELWVRPASMWSELVEVGGEKVERFRYVGEKWDFHIYCNYSVHSVVLCVAE